MDPAVISEQVHRTDQWNRYSIGYPDVVLVIKEKSKFDEEFYRKSSETSTPHVESRTRLSILQRSNPEVTADERRKSLWEQTSEKWVMFTDRILTLK